MSNTPINKDAKSLGKFDLKLSIGLILGFSIYLLIQMFDGVGQRYGLFLVYLMSLFYPLLFINLIFSIIAIKLLKNNNLKGLIFSLIPKYIGIIVLGILGLIFIIDDGVNILNGGFLFICIFIICYVVYIHRIKNRTIKTTK